MEQLLELDGRILIWIQHMFNAEWLTPVMKAITILGEYGIFWIIVCLVMIICRKTRKIGIICGVSLALTFLCCNIITKPLVDRIRPWEVHEAVHAFLPPPGDASFPSGHASSSMSVAWAMFLATLNADRRLHRMGIAAVILALLIGFSRLYLGMHFPLDVICGLLMGMVCATAVWGAFRKYDRHRLSSGEEDI